MKSEKKDNLPMEQEGLCEIKIIKPNVVQRLVFLLGFDKTCEILILSEMAYIT